MPFRKAQAITLGIQECSNRLDALDEALRKDVGITAAMRTVMDSLYENGIRTVPAIARSKGVTRQHIQVLADKLVAAGLVSKRDNPGDRRSPLLALTTQGEAALERLRQQEIAVLTDLGRALRERDLDATLKTLDTLQAELDARLAKEAGHRD